MSVRRANFLATLLVAAHLLLALSYSLWNPAGEAPDEADHWAFVVYLAQERRLPEGAWMTQSKHPPLSHIGAALLASLAEPGFTFLRANPDVSIQPRENWSPNFFIHTSLEVWPWRSDVTAFHLARLWSVLLSTATVAAVYGLARTVWLRQPGLAVTATGIVAFLPEFAFIGSAINNDTAAALFGTLALWGGLAIYRADGDWRAGWWTPLALGLGLLSKVSTASLWPAVGLAIIAGAIRLQKSTSLSGGQRGSGVASRPTLLAPRWLWSGVIVLVPALLIASPWLLRNWRLYGDLTGMELVRQTIDLRTTPWTWGDTLWLLKGWFVSFWGKFGGAGHIPMAGWIYWLLAALTALSVVGFVRSWRRRTTDDRVVLALLTAAAVGVAIGIWQYSLTALGTDQGRLLFPALGALAILWVEGLHCWPPARWRVHFAATLLAFLTGLSLYGLFGVIRPAMAPPPTIDPSSLPRAVEPIGFGELTLIDWSFDKAVKLYWRSEQSPTQDWRTTLRVVTEDGSLVWEWRRSPGYGRWSTDRWPAGVVVEDVYIVGWPDWAGPGRYLVEVGLQPYDGAYATPVQGGQTVEGVFVQLGWWQRP
ncbi:MAG: ArnT family glycosyltransferase [Caldilinea sp.]